MSNILDALYKEHRELSTKLNAINQMIIAYGGHIPDTEDSISEENQPIMDTYDRTMSYRKKIIFVLRGLGKATASRIASFIHDHEKDTPLEQIHKSVTHFCWQMSSKGEIVSSKLDARTNEYSLK